MSEEARIEIMMERLGLVEKKPTIVVPPTPKPLPYRVSTIPIPDSERQRLTAQQRFIRDDGNWAVTPEDSSAHSSMRNYVGHTLFKYPETPQNLRSMTFADLDWVRIATREKIMKAIIDSVTIGESRFDMAFGGWFPRSNQFGLTPLRQGDIKSPYDTDELVLIYGWYDLRPEGYTIEIRPGSMRLPPFSPQHNQYNPGYSLFPEPIIIEPRSSVEINKDASGSTVRVPNDTTAILGYYFAPMARLIMRR